MPGVRAGVFASALVAPIDKEYVWDASQTSTVQQADGSAAVVDGLVATWRPSTGADTAFTRWTSLGATSATLQALSSVNGGTRVAVRSVAENLLYMPGSLPLYNVTWFLAYRWMGDPGSNAHVLSKGAYNQANWSSNPVVAGWGWLVKWGANSGDTYWNTWNYAWIYLDEFTVWNRSRDLNSLRVAVLQYKVTGTTMTAKTRLTHPTICSNQTYNLYPPLPKEVPTFPWSLGGYLSDVATRAVDTTRGADIAVHEVRVYASILDDTSIAGVTQSLNTKWA